MKFHYYSDTDSLYIDLSERKSVDSLEVAPGVVADFDSVGKLVGIDIDRASKVVNLSRMETHGFSADYRAVGNSQQPFPQVTA